MKKLPIKKGQFVYYDNELYKVHSVKLKANFKNDFYLHRMKDKHGVIAQSSALQAYQPQHHDSFIVDGSRYMIEYNRIPAPQDYILIVNPDPDRFSHYFLNTIEKVEHVGEKDVVTSKRNVVRHEEYAVMVPDHEKEGQPIDYLDHHIVPEHQFRTDDSIRMSQYMEQNHPIIGDLYYDTEEDMTVMVTAMNHSEMILGNGHHLSISDFLEGERYALTTAFEKQP